MPRPDKFIEIGRVAYAVSGPAKGKLCVIVDVIDQNRVLVDGPFTAVRRQEYQINRLQITKLRIRIQHGQRTKFVKLAWRDARIDIKWHSCCLAKKLRAKKIRNSLTDFDKFKVGYFKQMRNRLVRDMAEQLKKKPKFARKLNPTDRDYYIKQEAIRRAKFSANVKKHGSKKKYQTFLKEEVPKLKKEFKRKVQATKKEERANLKEALVTCGKNRSLREAALNKFARTRSGRIRFSGEGKMVLQEDAPKDINCVISPQRMKANKIARAKYIKEKTAKAKEAERLKKKAKRKRLAAAKRRPWAKKVKA